MKEIFQKSFTFISENISDLVQLALPPALIFAALITLSSMLPGTAGALMVFFAEVLANAFISASLIRYISARSYNQPTSVQQALLAGVAYTPAILLLYLLLSIPLMPWLFAGEQFSSQNAFALSFSTFIFFYIAIKATFADYLIVLDGKSTLGAIATSFRYTTGYVHKIVIVMMLSFIVSGFFQIMFFQPLEPGVSPDKASEFITKAIELIINFVTTILIFYIFTDSYLENQKAHLSKVK
ncbi:hypothetical protein [Desulfosediminicola sp.]|uniref:hypothetical protein n=1 Tax=Desulfosediminicola sp. TaxID=2886825 RepID=UPI003AF2D32D